MARFMGANPDETRVEVEPLDDADHTWFESAAEHIYQQYDKLDRGDPYWPFLIRPMLFEGYRFPPPPQPLRGRIVDPEVGYPDIVLYLGYALSTRIRDKIEELEPRVHQFFPVEVTRAGSDDAPVTYWLLNHLNRVNALLIRHSQFIHEKWPAKDKFPGLSRYMDMGGGNPILALDRRVIADKAIWYEYKMRKLFVSDTLAAYLDAQNITGWEASDPFTRRTKIIEVDGVA